MYEEHSSYGLGYINNFLPSARASAYLEYVTVAGYHEVNERYGFQYPEGIACVFMLFTLGGCGTISIAGRTHVLTAGTIAIVPPGTPMLYRTEGKAWSFLWLDAQGPRTSHLAKALNAEGRECFTVPSMEPYEQIIRVLIDMPSSNLNQELEISGMLNHLTDMLLSALFFSQTPHARLTAEIAAYLETHYAEKLSLDALGRLFFLSPNRLIDMFRAETGRTPYAYLMEYRLSRARTLLETTDLPVQHIARETGFGSAANFACQFRRAYGLSPRAYRSSLRP